MRPLPDNEPKREHGSKIAAMLFDRDGVLTYFDIAAAAQFFQDLLPISVYALAQRWQCAVEQNGAPRNFSEEQAFFSRFWAAIGDEFDLDAGQRGILASVDYARYVVSYPEVPATLRSLQGSNLRLGVLSNFTLASLEHSLAAAGLAGYFKAVCAAPAIGFAKPAARAYEIALATLQVDAGQCLYFDDEEECVAGAQRVGMRAYLVDRRVMSADWSRRIVPDLRSVLKIVSGG